MLLVLPLWLVLFAMLVGWGLFVIWILRRAGGAEFGGSLTMFQTMWLGYAGLIGFLLICSLVLPIARTALLLSCAPSIAGYALQRHVVVKRLRALRLRPRPFAVTACVIVVASLAIAYAAWDLMQWYDTGFYHQQMVKWNARYPAVPGLTNLHLRFGYANSVLLFGALVDGFWQGVAAHAMNGFLFAAVVGQWFAEIFFARTPRGRLRQTYCLFTLPFLLGKLWTIEIASLSTDLPLALLGAVLVLELLSLPVVRARLLPVALIVGLGAVALTTKLGGGALFGVAGFVALLLVRRDVTWRARVVLFALPAFLVVGWFARNLIVSGWLIFPVFGRLPFSWSVPSETASIHLRWIESWARMPGKPADQVLDHGFMHWFVWWFDELFSKSREMILLFASAALLAWRAAAGPASSAARRIGEWGAIAACILGLVQWFVAAPDLRFAGFLFWLLPAALLAPMIAGAMRDKSVRAVIFAFSLVMSEWSGGLRPRSDTHVPDLWSRPPDLATSPTQWIETGPGTRVLVPSNKVERCFDNDLPCTPEPNTQTLRDPGSLGAGFYPGP